MLADSPRFFIPPKTFAAATVPGIAMGFGDCKFARDGSGKFPVRPLDPDQSAWDPSSSILNLLRMFRTFPISTCLLFLLLPMIGFCGLRAAPATPAEPKSDFPTGLAEIELRGNSQVILDGDLSADISDGTDFGSILACNGSVVRSFVIHNLGLDSLVLNGIAITGSGVVSASALPGSIAPGQSHTFTLTFDPAAVGLLPATVTISSNDVDEASFEFGIACTGLADVTPPTALCRSDTIFVDQNGVATLTPAQINNNSSDNCGVASLTLNQTTFGCQSYNTLVTLTVTDGSGNVSTCSTMILVDDTIRPVANCPATRTEYAAQTGVTFLVAQNYNLGSTDNCGVPPQGLSLSPAKVFCGSTSPYTTPVILTVSDMRLNQRSCTTLVTVVDASPPTMYACPTGNVTLNASGTGVVPPPAPSFNIQDNCGLASLVYSPSTFTCANVGVNPVVLIATDWVGLVSSCSTTVTVTENTPPAAICQSATLNLGAGGTATLTASSIDGGSTDNCGITTRVVSPSAFNCSQIGVRPVTLTVTDQGGNSSTCSTTVTVVDATPPVLNCPTRHVQLNAQGNVTLSAANLVQSATDNCAVSSLVASQTTFTCADFAGTPVSITATDASGNTQSCTVTVIADPQPFSAVLSAMPGACGYHVSCEAATDGTANAVVSGGCPPYTYLWSNGATASSASGLGAGVYAVTVTDGRGVSSTQTVTLIAPPPLNAQVVAMTPACVGTSTGTLTTAVTGGNACLPYQYQWSNGDTSASLQAVPPGNYILTVTSGPGCNAVLTGSVAALPLPVPAVTQVGNTLQTSPGFVSYQWYSGASPLPGETLMNFSPAGAGVFWVEVIDSNGCVGASAPFTYVPVAVRAGDLGLDELVLYPNPSDGNFQFRVVLAIEAPVVVSITSLWGQQLGTWQLPWLRGGEAFGVSHLASGVYLVELRCADGSRKVFQLLRE
jgi:SprB repeat/HYR domain